MASIKERKKKDGSISFKITVSLGYNSAGKQITKSITYTPPKGMSDKRIRTEVDKKAIFFEESLKGKEIVAQRARFAEVADRWLAYEEDLAHIKTGTIETYKGYRSRVYALIGHMYLDKISRATIQRLIFDLANGKDGGKKLSEKTQHNYISFISDVFNYAIYKLNILSSSPVDGIETKNTPKKERDIYSTEEEIELLKRLTDSKVPLTYKTFYMFVIFLGLRKGEALGIEWSDINFEKKSVYIHRNLQYRNSRTGVYDTTTKTKTSNRCLKLSDELIDILGDLKAEQEANKQKCGKKWVNSNKVFCNSYGKALFPSQPYNYLKNFCKREGLPFKTLKGFRHSMVTNAIHSGIDISTVSAMAGHSNPATTLRIYTHEIREHTLLGCDIIAENIRKGLNNDQTKAN